jgi:hypothetical protein
LDIRTPLIKDIRIVLITRQHEQCGDHLLEGTWVAYTDGSQTAVTHNEAGSFIEHKHLGAWVKDCLGTCYLGMSTEVIDNEIHAVNEALKFILTIDPPPKRIIICIDNMATASLLQQNSLHLEYVHAAQLKAIDLTVTGQMLVRDGYRHISTFAETNMQMSLPK